MSRKCHYLKTEPVFYIDAVSGKKPFEVRFNDRDYQTYDYLFLQEWCGGYTGRETQFEVTYVLDSDRFCKEGYVIMGIKMVGEEHIVNSLRTL
jgi:hypothetical protein